MPDVPDFKMFLKLLNLTTSSFDGEALSAIRMANAVLARSNQTWEDLLEGRVMMTKTQDADKYTKSVPIKHNDIAEINRYFGKLSERNLGTFREWVDSVYDFWCERGYLTDAQYKTLKKAAQR